MHSIGLYVCPLASLSHVDPILHYSILIEYFYLFCVGSFRHTKHHSTLQSDIKWCTIFVNHNSQHSHNYWITLWRCSWKIWWKCGEKEHHQLPMYNICSLYDFQNIVPFQSIQCLDTGFENNRQELFPSELSTLFICLTFPYRLLMQAELKRISCKSYKIHVLLKETVCST